MEKIIELNAVETKTVMGGAAAMKKAVVEKEKEKMVKKEAAKKEVPEKKMDIAEKKAMAFGMVRC